MKYKHSMGDISYYEPESPKPIAFSSCGTLMHLIGLSECCETINEMFESISYDREAQSVLREYIIRGYGTSQLKFI